MPKKLTRREAALIRHAARKAVLEYKEKTTVGVMVGGRVLFKNSILQHEAIQQIESGRERGIFFQFGEGTQLVIGPDI